MNFLGCEGVWQQQGDGSTVCSGTLKTYTVQEMRSELSPALTTAQRYELMGGLLALFVFVWVLKTVRHSV